MKGPVKILAGLSLLCVSFLCACNTDSEELGIDGNYCTVRDGITGLVSSEVYITPDTTGSHDYIISNISGYPNSSEAYKDVSAYLIGEDVLRITEYEHVISNDANLKIWGRGELMNGVISFEIHTQRDEINSYDLSLVTQDLSLIGKTFLDENQRISIQKNTIEFMMVDNQDSPHNFTLPIEISTCYIEDFESEITNTIDESSEELIMSMFYRGDKLVGTMKFSRDNWSSETSIDFSLLISN